MMKHVEMIIDYITDGTDYQYNDNHGVLTRCRDCEHWKGENNCVNSEGMAYTAENDYCSRAVRKDAENIA